MPISLTPPKAVLEARKAGALFVISHSGGKDSQAMTALLRGFVPPDQLMVVHAHLRDVDWPDAEEHARRTSHGLEFHRVEAKRSFFELVAHRRSFPTPRSRWCTSDLKREPINKWLRRLCRERNLPFVVQCLGMRAEESTARASRPVFSCDKRLTIPARRVYQWLPIHHLTEAEVFAAIRSAGQTPHWAYAEGMSRFSCCFCIMAKRRDLQIAGRLQPALLRRYVGEEKRLGFTLQAGRTLEETLGTQADVTPSEQAGERLPSHGRRRRVEARAAVRSAD